MKTNKLYCLLVLILLVNSETVYSQSKRNFKTVKSALQEYVHFEKDTIFSGMMIYDYPNPPQCISDIDSTIQFGLVPQRIFFDGFIISDHEVTVAEYFEFINDLSNSSNNNQQSKSVEYSYRDAQGDIKRIDIYPDMTVWDKQLPNGHDSQLHKEFLIIEKYKDHPIIGLSYDQASAYIYWRNIQLNKLLTENGFKEDDIVLRLPEHYEWEFAALYLPKGKLITERIYYPWGFNELTDKKGNYMANFGSIKTNFSVQLKSYFDDGFGLTAPVKSFPPNGHGLYDMAGNAREWTLSSPTQVQKDYPNDTSEKIVKGGSFNSSVIHLQIGTRQFVKKETRSNDLGFRVAGVTKQRKLFKEK